MPLLFLSHVNHISHVYIMLIDWLMFKGEEFYWFAEFHIALSPDQLLYNFSLIKSCSACAKQNAVVNASDACLLLAK